MILFPWQRKKCTEETTGEIAGTRWDGDYMHLHVAYTVDGFAKMKFVFF